MPFAHIMKKLNRALQILVVEDSENDALLLELAIERAGARCVCRRVETAEEMSSALDAQEWDAIVADYVMPKFDGLAALAMVKERGLDVPFIIVSGHITESTAVAAMKAGAHDYVMKDKLARLAPAIAREMRDAEVRRERRAAEEERRQAVEALRRSHEELELRVRQRTADLSAANAQLQAALVERRRLEHELLEITDKERRRIGLNLHDDLGQKLTGIALMSKGLQVQLAKHGSEGAAEAARIHTLIQETMNQTRELSHDLVTLDLQEKDLATAMEGMVSHVKRTFNISCRFECETTAPVLEGNSVSQLYKITQEAVTNAIKHAKARNVEIRLSNGGNHLKLSIRNDGAPFPSVVKANAGLGLRIMSYRANLIGASFEVRPGEREGAVVTCSLPVPS